MGPYWVRRQEGDELHPRGQPLICTISRNLDFPKEPAKEAAAKEQAKGASAKVQTKKEASKVQAPTEAAAKGQAKQVSAKVQTKLTCKGCNGAAKGP